MNKLLTLILLAAYTAAGPTNMQPSQNLNCLEHDNEFFSCIAVKTVSALNRAARSSDIEIIDGVTLVRDTPMERVGKSLEINEIEIMNELPSKSSDRMIKLFNMIYDSALSFVKSYSLKLGRSEGSVSRALVEGRAKIKKMILPLAAALGLKTFALAPILMGGLGLLALKALLIGKIALLAAGFMAFQKLFGGSYAGGNFFNKNPAPLWYDNAGSWAAANGSPGYRSLDRIDAKVDAQNVAYSAHIPADNGTD